MHRNLYTFYFENNGNEDEVEVLAFSYAEAEILAKAEQIHAGRPWQTIKRYKCSSCNAHKL